MFGYAHSTFPLISPMFFIYLAFRLCNSSAHRLHCPWHPRRSRYCYQTWSISGEESTIRRLPRL